MKKQKGVQIQISFDTNNIILLAGMKPDYAMEICTEKLKEDANNVAALTGKGFALVVQRHYKEALVYLEKILNLSPKNKDAIVGIITCFQALGKKTDAYRWAKKAIKLFPKDKRVLTTIDMTLRGQI